MPSVVVTLVGPDRPGLVNSLSEHVAACGGNWLESRMAHLAGQFAGIVLVTMPEPGTTALAGALAKLETEGFRVVVKEGAAAAGAVPRPATDTLLHLEVVAQDRPGIIRDITAILARRGVNIEELSTHVLSGSFSGEVLFRAEARLRAPADTTIEALRTDVEHLGNELMVDIRPAERPSEI